MLITSSKSQLRISSSLMLSVSLLSHTCTFISRRKQQHLHLSFRTSFVTKEFGHLSLLFIYSYIGFPMSTPCVMCVLSLTKIDLNEPRRKQSSFPWFWLDERRIKTDFYWRRDARVSEKNQMFSLTLSRSLMSDGALTNYQFGTSTVFSFTGATKS